MDSIHQCYICQGEETPLISPCKCTGSVEYVHSTCLASYIASKPLTWNPVCSMCKSNLHTVRSNRLLSAVLVLCFQSCLLALKLRIVFEIAVLYSVDRIMCNGPFKGQPVHLGPSPRQSSWLVFPLCVYFTGSAFETIVFSADEHREAVAVVWEECAPRWMPQPNWPWVRYLCTASIATCYGFVSAVTELDVGGFVDVAILTAWTFLASLVIAICFDRTYESVVKWPRSQLYAGIEWAKSLQRIVIVGKESLP